MVLYPLDGGFSYLDGSSQSNVIISKVVVRTHYIGSGTAFLFSVLVPALDPAPDPEIHNVAFCKKYVKLVWNYKQVWFFKRETNKKIRIRNSDPDSTSQMLNAPLPLMNRKCLAIDKITKIRQTLEVLKAIHVERIVSSWQFFFLADLAEMSIMEVATLHSSKLRHNPDTNPSPSGHIKLYTCPKDPLHCP